MDTVEQQLNQVDWKNPESIIRFYESNQLYFDNYQVAGDESKISNLIDIKLHYVNALYSKSHYDKVMKVLDQVQDLLAKLRKDHWNYSKSEQYFRFMKGRVLADRKNFRESFAIFKELVREDPEHHYYWVWYRHARLGLSNWIFNTMSTVGLTLVFLDFLFSLDKLFGVEIGIIGAILAILSYLSWWGLRELYKRKKAPPNNLHVP